MPEDGALLLNGLRLHYRAYGDEGQPVLLFLHGLTGNAHGFDHVAAQFAASHRVLALDFRGHGDSEWASDGDYAFANHVRDAFAFLDALRVSKASLIGSSLGGVVAMIVASMKPELAHRLVLNDIGPEINFPAPAQGAKPPNHLELEFRDVGEALACYRLSYPPAQNLPDAVAIELVRNSTRVGANGLLRWTTDPRVQAIAPSSGGSDGSAGLWRFFDSVKAPILVLRGAQSDALLPGTVEKMRARHPATTVVEVPGVGHTPWMSEPQALAALRDFLR